MTTDAWIVLGIGALIVVLFGASLLAPRGHRAAPSTDGRLDALARRVDEVEGVAKEALHDVRGVRMSLGQLATKDSVNSLALQVAELRGDMKSLVQQSASTAHQVGLVSEFLMKSSAEAIAGAKGAENKL